MTDADAVRRVALPLPRAVERQTGGRWKHYVGQIVFLAFADDEQAIGFGFPKEQRDDLVASAPGTFFLPPTRDLRFNWVCARLAPLDDDEMRELVTDAWRMCVPRMLHDLPDLPAPAAQAWALIDARDFSGAHPLLHPHLHWQDRDVVLTGRSSVLAHLRQVPRPRPPDRVEVRDGQVHRWERD
ncbi:MAG TPA: MmcQ/YjbR family DNA-binding protein [Nocardioides sp.]|nr:MmcQ/YjbR family DNA-binding protein [Nocardioides sp.]